MRLSLPTLLTVAISLVSIVNAHQDHTLDARDYVDDLIARKESYAYDALERRELFADISTRELLNALSDHLVKREKRWDYICEHCGNKYLGRHSAGQTTCTVGPGGKHKVDLKRTL